MNKAGFSLLEVILALAILAGAAVVLGEANRMALHNAARSRDLTIAQMLCETKMAEITAGFFTATSVSRAAFDPSTYSLDAREPGWLYSIEEGTTDEDGLISIRVTVTRDLPAVQHPVQFSLVRWIPDPNSSSTNSSSSTSSSSSSSSTGQQ